MTRFSDTNQIWSLRPTLEDLQAGARYASITLPWTFNRMMMNTGSAGQQHRAINIAKGVVAQEMLRREFEKQGVSVQLQRKSHRDEDLFDFRVPIDGETTKLDVKSIHYFTDYGPVGRAPFKPSLVAQNADYSGPDWRNFFPMLVPHTQIPQAKEAYCFAIASSIDIRRDWYTDRPAYALTAFPSGEMLPFLSSRRLCIERENAGQGFYLSCTYEAAGLLNGNRFRFTILGEWAGELKHQQVMLRSGEMATAGPFSCVSSFQIDEEDHDRLVGRIVVTVSRNDFTTPIRNSARRNINVVPEQPLVLRSRDDFCNLILPLHYELHVVGWIRKDEFLERCRQYTGWVWPDDRVNRYYNQPWSQVTNADEATLKRYGFLDAARERPLRAGWMKTHGRGGGACCYVFPNIGSNGGVKETNLYVLPQDLQTMEAMVFGEE